MPTKNIIQTVINRMAFLLVVPVLCSCALTKKQALERTKMLAPYKSLAAHVTNKLSFPDWDSQQTCFNYVWRKSNPTNVTFVFIHGYPASLFTWADIIAPVNPAEHPKAEALASQANLLALDLPGHGFTTHGREKKQPLALLEPTNAARFVIKFLDKVGVSNRVVLVGHSLGALVALNAARQVAAEAALSETNQTVPRKWNVAALVLISPEGAPRTRTDYLAGEGELRHWFTGWLAGWHGLVYRCGWLTRPGKICDMFRRGFWQVEAEAAIRDVTTNKCVTVPAEQSKAYSLLMRNRENYHSNRTLVRRDEPGEYDLLSWAAQSFHGKRHPARMG